MQISPFIAVFTAVGSLTFFRSNAIMNDRPISGFTKKLPINSLEPEGIGFNVLASGSLSQSGSSRCHPKQQLLLNYLTSEFPMICNSKSDSVAGKALLEWLKLNGIKCIAADFDLTMLTTHSGGWLERNDPRSPVVLNSLSPSFKVFGAQAKAEGFKLAVVTFSDSQSIPLHLRKLAIGGEQLVQAVINTSGNPFKIDKVVPFFPRNYQIPGAYRLIGLSAPMPETKSYHLGQLRSIFGFRPDEIVLIDDALGNCVDAVDQGYLGIHVSGNHGFHCSSLKGVGCN